MIAGAFALFTAGLLAYAITWIWQDFRAFSRAWDERDQAMQRAAYAEARRRHASYAGLRVMRGGRYVG